MENNNGGGSWFCGVVQRLEQWSEEACIKLENKLTYVGSTVANFYLDLMEDALPASVFEEIKDANTPHSCNNAVARDIYHSSQSPDKEHGEGNKECNHKDEADTRVVTSAIEGLLEGQEISTTGHDAVASAMSLNLGDEVSRQTNVEKKLINGCNSVVININELYSVRNGVSERRLQKKKVKKVCNSRQTPKNRRGPVRNLTTVEPSEGIDRSASLQQCAWASGSDWEDYEVPLSDWEIV